jgi:hypothetical protein
MKISRYLATLVCAVVCGCINYAPTTVTLLEQAPQPAVAPTPAPVVVVQAPLWSIAPLPPRAAASAAEARIEAAILPPPPDHGPTKAAAARLQHAGCGPLVLPVVELPTPITIADLDKAKDASNALATSMNLQNLLVDRLIRAVRYNENLRKSWADAVSAHNRKCNK